MLIVIADGKSPSGLGFFEVVDCNNVMLIYNPEGDLLSVINMNSPTPISGVGYINRNEASTPKMVEYPITINVSDYQQFIS